MISIGEVAKTNESGRCLNLLRSERVVRCMCWGGGRGRMKKPRVPKDSALGRGKQSWEQWAHRGGSNKVGDGVDGKKMTGELKGRADYDACRDEIW